MLFYTHPHLHVIHLLDCTTNLIILALTKINIDLLQGLFTVYFGMVIVQFSRQH
jgi:hypothetical protein